jgi:hypothetical protein
MRYEEGNGRSSEKYAWSEENFPITVFCYLLLVIRLHLEGSSLIPIVGILRGGGGE